MKSPIQRKIDLRRGKVLPSEKQIEFACFCRAIRKRKNWGKAIVADLAGIPVEVVYLLEEQLLFPEEFEGYKSLIEYSLGCTLEKYKLSHPMEKK